MGRSPCCDENGIKKGPWTPEEDQKLVDFIKKHGHGSWTALPKLAGLNRCGKSCRLRWTNYLRPNIKRGKFSQEEEQTIMHLHSILGNKWSSIASHLPGRTENEIKNFWNTHLKKKFIKMGFDPMTHRPRTDIFTSLDHLINLANLRDLIEQPPLMEEQAMKLQAEALQMANLQQSHYLLLNTLIETEALNLLNSIPQISNQTLMQNQALSDFEPAENVNSQLLLNNAIMLDPQVPVNFQTSLNNCYNSQPNSHWINLSPSYSFPPPISGSISLSNIKGDVGST